MNYENFSDKQKQVVEIIKNVFNKLNPKDIKNYISGHFDYYSCSFGSYRTPLGLIMSACDLYHLSYSEAREVYDLARAKNYWLKFDPSLLQ